MQNSRTYLRIASVALAIFIISCSTVRADPMRAEDFDGKSVTLSGEGWSATKHLETDDYGNENCYVRIEAGGETVHNIATSPNTGWALEDQDWTRLHVLKTPGGLPDLLAIVWFAGGAHGPVSLRLVALEGSYPIVFDYTGVTFGYLEDLDGDGMPEAVLHSLSFEYFYQSAVSFSRADSPFPLLVATYDPSRKQYAWANNLFAGVLAQEVDKSRERFLKQWPEDKKISADIALNQQSREAFAYRAMMCWAVNTCYARGESAAVSIIDAHTDPVLAVFARHALRMALRKDANYSFMMNNPIAR